MMGIIGSVGIQNNSEADTKYKLKISYRGTYVTTSFFMDVVSNNISSVSDLASYILAHGNTITLIGPSGTLTSCEVDHVLTAGDQATNQILYPLDIDVFNQSSVNVRCLMITTPSAYKDIIIEVVITENWSFEYVE